MVAATGAGMTAVEHELLGRQPRQVRDFVEMRRAGDEFVPGSRRLDVDFDDARVGSDAEVRQSRIARRLVTFENHR